MLRLKISVSEFKSNLFFVVIPSLPKLHFHPVVIPISFLKTLFFCKWPIHMTRCEQTCGVKLVLWSEDSPTSF